jgi:hypothetical protein
VCLFVVGRVLLSSGFVVVVGNMSGWSTLTWTVDGGGQLSWV